MQDRAGIEKAKAAVLGKGVGKGVLSPLLPRTKPEKRVYATREFKKALSLIAKARNVLEPVARDREKIWRADVSMAMDALPKLDSVAHMLKSAIDTERRSR